MNIIKYFKKKKLESNEDILQRSVINNEIIDENDSITLENNSNNLESNEDILQRSVILNEIIDENDSITLENNEIDENKSNNLESNFEINNNLDLNDYKEDFTKNILINYFSNPYMTNSKFKSYIIDIEFIKICKKWSLNRDLNIDHWKNIYKSYEKEINDNNNLILNNTICIALYKNNFYILDGQHRIKAIKELLKKYVFSCKIRIDLYYTNNYDNMIKVLKDINSTCPLQIENKIIGNINDILTFFKSNFIYQKSNIIKPNNCVRPFINENLMVEKIRNSSFLISSTNMSTVIKYITKINNEYSKMSIDQLRFDNKKITERMYLQAQKYNCFLGFDKSFQWIDEINKILEIKFIKKV